MLHWPLGLYCLVKPRVLVQTARQHRQTLIKICWQSCTLPVDVLFCKRALLYWPLGLYCLVKQRVLIQTGRQHRQTFTKIYWQCCSLTEIAGKIISSLSNQQNSLILAVQDKPYFFVSLHPHRLKSSKAFSNLRDF